LVIKDTTVVKYKSKVNLDNNIIVKFKRKKKERIQTRNLETYNKCKISPKEAEKFVKEQEEFLSKLA
jgi:hypothetical protein